MRDLFIIVVGLGLVPFALWRPYVGVFAWAWFSLMIPHQLAWGIASSFSFVQIFAIATFLSFAIEGFRTTRWNRFPLRQSSFIILFNIWVAVTTAFAFDYDLSVPRLVIFLKVFALGYIIILTVRTRETLHGLIWIVVISLGFYGAKGGVFSLVTGGDFRVWGPSGSYIGDNNSIALAMTMTIPLIYYLFRNTALGILRLGLLLAIPLSALSVVTTFSRGGLVALSCMSVVLLLKTGGNRLIILMVGGALALGALNFLPAHWFERMSTIETFDEDASFQGRLDAWDFAWNLANDNPIVGGGFDVFYHTPSYDTYAPEAAPNRAAHSVIFQVLAEHGFFGLFLYLMIWVNAWLGASRVRSRTEGRTDVRWAYDLAGMLQASMAGYFVAGLFLSVAYFDLFIVLISLVIVLSVVAKKNIGEDEIVIEKIY